MRLLPAPRQIDLRRPEAGARGFTLVELMIAVAIIGVLATLATVGYKKYIDGSRISEPLATLQAIRSSEEQVRHETGHYLDVSASGTYFPINASFGSTIVPWDGTAAAAHADYARWKQLEVTVDGKSRFGYKANAGLAGAAILVPVEFKPKPVFPNPPTDDWYVLQAKGDPDRNGAPTLLITASYNSEIAILEDAP